MLVAAELDHVAHERPELQRPEPAVAEVVQQLAAWRLAPAAAAAAVRIAAMPAVVSVPVCRAVPAVVSVPSIVGVVSVTVAVAVAVAAVSTRLEKVSNKLIKRKGGGFDNEIILWIWNSRQPTLRVPWPCCGG